MVLESSDASGRELASTVQACDLQPHSVETIDELAEDLKQKHALVALIAFEAIWRDPQRAVRKLRSVAPEARLIVAYSDGTPRLHLGRRLWAVNLIDYFISRSTPPHEMRPVLRQAYAEALIEASNEESEQFAGTGDDQHLAEYLARGQGCRAHAIGHCRWCERTAGC